MPKYKGHLVGGAATFALVYYTSTKILSYPAPPTREAAFALSFCLLGSLFPDIDTKSFGQRIFYILLTIIILVAIFSKQWGLLSVLSLISVFPLLVNHRGIIHSLWFVTLAPLIIPLIITYNSPQLSSAAWSGYGYFVAGAISHLILDYGPFRMLKQGLLKK